MPTPIALPVCRLPSAIPARHGGVLEIMPPLDLRVIRPAFLHYPSLELPDHLSDYSQRTLVSFEFELILQLEMTPAPAAV